MNFDDDYQPYWLTILHGCKSYRLGNIIPIQRILYYGDSPQATLKVRSEQLGAHRSDVWKPMIEEFGLNPMVTLIVGTPNDQPRIIEVAQYQSLQFISNAPYLNSYPVRGITIPNYSHELTFLLHGESRYLS